MKDSVFRFKQFAVRNERSAMKIGTDGVLLGAWCNTGNARRLLDIGTGTGVIALMLAQRVPQAHIDAVEIDTDSYNEALGNFAQSPWSSRITAIHADFNQFASDTAARYDLIVSNPPFFTNGALPPKEARMQARHCTSLSFSQLIAGATRLITPDGRISLITPCDARRDVESAATRHGLHITRQTTVCPKPDGIAKRILWELTPAKPDSAPAQTLTDTLTIESDEQHNFTPQYTALTRDFYLKM